LRRRTLCSARLLTVSIPQPFRIVHDKSIASRSGEDRNRSRRDPAPRKIALVIVDAHDRLDAAAR
jgi:hypothetical protein